MIKSIIRGIGAKHRIGTIYNLNPIIVLVDIDTAGKEITQVNIMERYGS
jgi:hypothetical protein